MQHSTLGRGWRFPVKVDRVTGRIELSEGEDDVREAILLIIRTHKGERIMNPMFGSDASKFVFAGTAPATRGMLAESIKRAIEDWEARVDDVRVTVSSNPDSLQVALVSVEYTVIETDSRRNLVFPYDLGQ